MTSDTSYYASLFLAHWFSFYQSLHEQSNFYLPSFCHLLKWDSYSQSNYSIKHYRDQIDKINSIVCESIFEGIISVSKLVFLSSLSLKEIRAPNCRLFKFHLTSRQVSRHPPSYIPINFRFNFRPRSLFIYSISSPFNSHRLPFAKNGIFH